MKKSMLFGFFCSICCLGFSQAEETSPKKEFHQHEISFHLGDPSFHLDTWYDYDFNHFSWMRDDYYNKWTITTPSITASYLYRPLKWFWIGADISYTGNYKIAHDLISETKIGKSSTHQFVLSPHLRFSYLNKEKVNLYSGIAVGFCYSFTKNNFTELEWYGSTDLGLQVTAIGISVGKRWIGLAELGYGYKGIFNLGIGYRFK